MEVERREKEKEKEKWVSDYSTLMMLSKNFDFIIAYSFPYLRQIKPQHKPYKLTHHENTSDEIYTPKHINM